MIKFPMTRKGEIMKISMNKSRPTMSYAQENSKTLEEGFLEFIESCELRNLSDKTVEFYENCFKIILRVKDKEGEPLLEKDTELFTIQPNDIAQITKYLLEHYKETSVNSYLRGVRAIFYYFMDLHYMDKCPVELVRAKKVVKPTYTDEELEKLLKKPNIKAKNASFSEYRNWVLINYLLATGNRVSTVCNIKNYNVNLQTDNIVLEKTKNRKEQVIPISRSLHIILKEYMSYRGGEAEDYLFCNQSGFKWTEDACKHAIAKYNKKRGVRKTSIHLFRHTFAKKWILNGGDPFRLQKLLGHSSMEIVREYVEMFGDDLSQQFNDFNPLESIQPRQEKVPTMKGRRMKK